MDIFASNPKPGRFDCAEGEGAVTMGFTRSGRRPRSRTRVPSPKRSFGRAFAGEWQHGEVVLLDTQRQISVIKHDQRKHT